MKTLFYVAVGVALLSGEARADDRDGGASQGCAIPTATV